jgi:hypothetical protein
MGPAKNNLVGLQVTKTRPEFEQQILRRSVTDTKTRGLSQYSNRLDKSWNGTMTWVRLARRSAGVRYQQVARMSGAAAISGQLRPVDQKT